MNKFSQRKNALNKRELFTDLYKVIHISFLRSAQEHAGRDSSQYCADVVR